MEEVKVFKYPVEYLDEKVYLQPISMRKADLSILLGRSWDMIRHDTKTKPRLQEYLKAVNYRVNQKTLYPEHVSAFFMYYTPPKMGVENNIHYMRIKKYMRSDLKESYAKVGLIVAA